MCPCPNILRLVAVVAVSQKLQMKLSLLKMWTIFSWKTPKKMNVTQLRIQKLLQYMTVMKTLSMGQMTKNKKRKKKKKNKKKKKKEKKKAKKKVRMWMKDLLTWMTLMMILVST
ncbi:uncharacterized protein LOC113347396 [Papaver somniferum]|uniref:uncharacterized protein LOC113347396 n=1 Tax=Papaver somniferum TaxID=3469 RepID=UPI000E6FD55B|nr:uncharacterized protein LOC113347396 [Papaver somniferum]